MTTTAVLAFWAVFAAAWGGLLHNREGRRRPLRPGRASILVWCAVALPSLLQLTVAPELLDLGQRERAAILDGQLWRLVTSLVLQDGGWLGGVSNLAVLAVTLVLVRGVLTGRGTLVTFVAGGMVANVLTVATIGQSGAGSSMATMFLAATALVIVRRGRPATLAVLVLGAAALVLVLQRDMHGLAAAGSLITGVLVSLRRPARG